LNVKEPSILTGGARAGSPPSVAAIRAARRPPRYNRSREWRGSRSRSCS
jgi:hypothetical protein